jgi:hypothetical protein
MFLLQTLIMNQALTSVNISRQQWAIGPGSQSPAYPIPLGIDLTACKEPLRNGGPNKASFEISSLSDTVLLLSGGSGLHGSVRVTTTSADTESVKFSVDLSTNWNREADTIVCSLERKNGESGVGVFVSNNFLGSDTKLKRN